MAAGFGRVTVSFGGTAVGFGGIAVELRLRRDSGGIWEGVSLEPERWHLVLDGYVVVEFGGRTVEFRFRRR